MDGWQRTLLIILMPLNLCGFFLMMAAGQLPADTGGFRVRVLIAGLLLGAPGVIFMLLTLPWRSPDLEDEDGDDDEEAGPPPA